MKLNSIEEITIKVSPISQKGTQHPNQKAFNKEMENSSSNDLEKQKGEILQKILAKKGILENKKIPKLLIIQCSDAKNPNGDISSHLNFNFGLKLSELGTIRKKYYENLFGKQPNYFFEKNINNLEYYKDAFNSNLKMLAINRYNGIFFKNNKRSNFLTKIQGSNLHILIISGLYGLLQYDDQIIDYNLNIKKGSKNWYGDEIHNSVIEYINSHKIPNECVFYSLGIKKFTNSYYNALNPIEEWTDLWIKNGRGHSSSKFIQNDFLSRI